MKGRLVSPLALCLAILSPLIGCGGGAGAPTVATVGVTPNPAQQVQVAATVQLTATARDASGNIVSIPPASFTWEMTSGASFASVNSTGLVTGLAEGTATVRATETGSAVSGEAQVNVSAAPPGPVASVEVTPNPAQVQVGGTVQLTATARDASGNVLSIPPANFTWEVTSGASFAWVSSTGLVDGLAVGTATVRATESESGVSGDAEVVVSAAPSVGRIAFASTRDGNEEIYVMDSNGTNQTRRTYNPAMDWDPCWSPDGSKIAFFSWRDGNSEIYVMNSDGTNPVNLTDNPAADAWPSWSPF